MRLFLLRSPRHKKSSYALAGRSACSAAPNLGLNSGGRIIGQGKYPAWLGLIRPFRDRPDITVPFLWYSVPWSNPSGPSTVFTDRFWDEREHWFPDGPGTVPGSLKPYFGKVPGPDVTPMEGRPFDWANGFSYARFLAGEYGPATCWPIVSPLTLLRQKQRESVRLPSPVRVRGNAGESASVETATPLLASAAEAVPSAVPLRAASGEGTALALVVGVLRSAAGESGSATGLPSVIRSDQGEAAVSAGVASELRADAGEATALTFGSVLRADAGEQDSPWRLASADAGEGATVIAIDGFLVIDQGEAGSVPVTNVLTSNAGEMAFKR